MSKMDLCRYVKRPRDNKFKRQGMNWSCKIPFTHIQKQEYRICINFCFGKILEMVILTVFQCWGMRTQ